MQVGLVYVAASPPLGPPSTWNSSTSISLNIVWRAPDEVQGTGTILRSSSSAQLDAAFSPSILKAKHCKVDIILNFTEWFLRLFCRRIRSALSRDWSSPSWSREDAGDRDCSVVVQARAQYGPHQLHAGLGLLGTFPDQTLDHSNIWSSLDINSTDSLTQQLS